ncbi:hypothetical protein Mth01_14840 [Sphaerimonospora thailandensis]|uniref:Uncharacterized protein n=1 Tax=Sphaerimonospora thailandensis TaxID=795644 RepID=A0A8J3R7I1_9ACTN|nr:hypothetical protein Mth01_14840 [Sphaerimonospora thailandensis]
MRYAANALSPLNKVSRDLAKAAKTTKRLIVGHTYTTLGLWVMTCVSSESGYRGRVGPGYRLCQRMGPGASLPMSQFHAAEYIAGDR